MGVPSYHTSEVASQYLKPGDWVKGQMGRSASKNGASPYYVWDGTNWKGVGKQPPGDEVK